MKKDIFDEESGTTTANRPRGGETPGTSRSDLSKEEMMKRVQETGTPGAGHEALQALEGDWNAEVHCFMDPGAQAEVHRGTASVQSILGGRFLEEEFHSEMMGKPFTGRGIFGYDNTKQKFVSVWLDDMNTGIHVSEGRGDHGNKVISLEGKSNCAATGQQDVPMGQIIRVLSPDKHMVELYNDGRKTMEITYTRA